MKVIGALLICFSLGMRTAQNIGDNQFDYAFAIIIIGILLILFDKSEKYKGIPKMENPPAPPKKCICNDIGKHTPGGRCEAEHSLIPIPEEWLFYFWKWFLLPQTLKKHSLSAMSRFSGSEAVKIHFLSLPKTCQNALKIDWFREVHDLHSYVERYDDGSFDYVITSDLFKEVFDYNDGPFETFLDAQNKSIVTMVSKIYDNKLIRPEMPKDRIG